MMRTVHTNLAIGKSDGIHQNHCAVLFQSINVEFFCCAGVVVNDALIVLERSDVCQSLAKIAVVIGVISAVNYAVKEYESSAVCTCCIVAVDVEL